MGVSQIHFHPYKSVLIQQQTGTANLIVIKITLEHFLLKDFLKVLS